MKQKTINMLGMMTFFGSLILGSFTYVSPKETLAEGYIEKTVTIETATEVYEDKLIVPENMKIVTAEDVDPIIFKVEEVIVEEPKEEEIITQKIDNTFDVLTPTNYSEEELGLALSSNAHKRLEPYIDTFVEAEEKYGVNSLYLLSTIGLESGWGRHMSAENNVGGWKNNSGDGFREFDSIEDSIMHVAMNISTSYKDAVGSNIEAVTSRYCPTPGYTDQVLNIMKQRDEKINMEVVR